ncbi:MAG: type II restriction endonuclease [Proteobacteria bacterium]|nr:type II restriction endonuclease [Pseudomonadota bacterium]MBU2613555.1 type II restriction endonuclease [Patescibacteria group bacterium]
MKNDLDGFIQTLRKSIITWDYFADFENSYKKAFELKIQLNILNSLIGEQDEFEKKFFQIIEKYPETRSALLVLIATRKKKIDELPIIDRHTLLPEKRSHLFDKKVKLSVEDKVAMWDFFTESGIRDIFQSNKIIRLEDYVFGVEVGLDSNARKNRTGKIMEKLADTIIADFCKKRSLEYLPEATTSKINDKFGTALVLHEVFLKRRGERRFDFAVFDRPHNKLTLFEVNCYTSSGSKPNSIAREYIDLNKYLKHSNVRFVWVTDGPGWLKMKNSLEAAMNSIDYVINLSMLKSGRLDEIFGY